MFRRIGIFLAAIASLGVVSAVPANAAPTPNGNEPGPHCKAEYFHQGAAEGISLKCSNADHDFQVIALCRGLLGYWWQDGSVAAEHGRSIALCDRLGFGRVVDYRVREVRR